MPTFKHPPTRINKISKPMTPQRRRRLWISYGLDWILTIGVWAVFYAIDKVNGYRRLFSITDTSLHHPFAEDERIHVWHLALIAGVFPLVVILVWTGAVRRSWFDAQVGVLGLGLTLGLTVTFTNIIKVSFLVRFVNVDFAS
jgi:diacylglycerol diphosphate phosphatase/phosphatidate phosphatase